MDLLILLFISIGLAMDCLAVSLAVGTGKNIPRLLVAVTLAFVFGGFQFGMSLVGWAAGEWLIAYISGFDHWVAFILLGGIGGKMIYEGLWSVESEDWAKMEVTTLLLLAVATSIDALGVGLSFALLTNTILLPALVIGIISAVFSFAGVLLGTHLAERFGERMEILGGIILIGIGVRILVGHLSG